jgi:hypothetical protein
MMYNYEYSYLFRRPGIILGCFILFFTLALLSIELGRLYSGSNTRGRNDSTEVFEYLISSDVIIGFNGAVYNPKIENRWMWPWSTPTLLFSLLFLTTGALGIISGYRESYTIILIFFISSLSSICLVIFLIASYATTIAGWKSIYGTSDGNLMPSFPRIDRDLSAACLAISCGLFIIFLISLVLAGINIDVCTRKEYPKPINRYGHQPVPNAPWMA